MPRVCITVQGKNAQPYRFSLERKVVRLGRASDNDIVIDCPSVSSHHCEMRRVDGGYILKDTGSTNGIKLSDDRMEIIDLDNNLEILVGDALMDFELAKDEKDELAKEDHKPQQRAELPKSRKIEDAEADRDRDSIPKVRSRRPSPAPTGIQRPTLQAPLASAQNTNSGANFAITIGFLFLALLAFYAGLAVGHSNKYPKNKYPDSKGLWGDMFSQEPTLTPKAKEPAPE